MANNNNLKPFKKGVSGNPKGRKKGVRNRATIIKELFNSVSVLNEEDFNQLQSKFPHIKNDMSIEYLMTLVQVNNAIFKGDLRAYKVLNEALYGTPIKELDREVEEDIIKRDEIDFTLLTDEELRILIKAFTKED
ncbi:MAG: DUF5681 domain-containing protein [Promethearchaeota archaeon]|jgi:hypothetical protein